MRHFKRFLVGLVVFALGGVAFVAGLWGISVFMHWHPSGALALVRAIAVIIGYALSCILALVVAIGFLHSIYEIGESFIDFWRNGH